MSWSVPSGAQLLRPVIIMSDWSGNVERGTLPYPEAVTQSTYPLTVIRTYNRHQHTYVTLAFFAVICCILAGQSADIAAAPSADEDCSRYLIQYNTIRDFLAWLLAKIALKLLRSPRERSEVNLDNNVRKSLTKQECL